MNSLGTLDELYKHAPKVDKKFEKFIKELSGIIGGKFKLGPIKERDVAEKKIQRDYEGKATLISDIIRGKVIADSPETISILREILNPESETHKLLKKHGVYCAQMTDYFADPKYETGYRCLNAKLAFPINGTDEEFLVELQVVHKDIEATYDKTHHHMREAQRITNKYQFEIMPLGKAQIRTGHYAVCKFYNGTASRQAGIDHLLDSQDNALSEREAASLDNMIRYLRFDY